MIAVTGPDGPLKREIVSEAKTRGLAINDDAETIICLSPASLDSSLHAKRLVVRSSAVVYGASDKNPGFMTEERVSLLRPGAKAARWLALEEKALQHSNVAVLRLTNLLAVEEGDLATKQLAKSEAKHIAGRDPHLQFLAVRDAARAFLAAAESTATGVFNIAPDDAIPLYKAFAAAGTARQPRPATAVDWDELRFNWTISPERAARELNFRCEKSTLEALREFVQLKPRARTELLDRNYDPWGLDLEFIDAWGWWFAFLRKVYWRIDFEGMDNIPAAGRAMFVANHRGFMPLDAVMHLSLVLKQRQRVIRFLIIPSLLRLPYLANFLVKLGGVVASQENAARLFASEALVGIFPEGIRGAFTPYKETYKLRDFAKSAFVKIAIENQSPIIPTAVIGHSEIFPIIGRIESSFVTKEYGWPYLPIAPMFPLAPVPIPSKWHVRVLPAVGLEGLKAADAENVKLVRDFSRYIQSIIQANLDDMTPKRKSWFWGKVLDGTSPPVPPFSRSA